jgi:hypothetical protein
MSFMRRLRKVVEKPYRSRWWGADHTIEAKLLPGRFGDGKFLVGIEPMNTRPQFYVVRVDSKWMPTKNEDPLESDDWHEFLQDDLCPALEDYFGRIDCEDDEYGGWPCVDLQIGCSWFPYRTPGPQKARTA